MRFNKRASLEIGVNTIVILVIAMTLLGLGVVFVRNLFTKVGGTVDVIEVGDIASPPTSDKPIKLVPTSIELKGGKTKDVQVLVYNKGAEQAFTVDIGKCSSGFNPEIEAIPDVMIEQGSYKGFQVLVTAKGEKWDSESPAKCYTDGDTLDAPQYTGTTDTCTSVNMDAKKHICQITATGSGSNPEEYTSQFIMEVTS